MTSTLEPQNDRYEEAVRELFAQAPFAHDLGMRLVSTSPGTCESELTLAARHLQQDGCVHAGVIASLADHTAGGAGVSLVPASQRVLSAEFRLSLLRRARGELLACRAVVLKHGKTLSVVESMVLVRSSSSEEMLVAKATVTLAILDATRLRRRVD
jgi:uncharacterized protein (TIGR00369 family)